MSASSDNAYYQALAEAISVDDPASDIQAVFNSIVENVAKTVRAKACSLALLTPDKKFLRHMASHGLSEGYLKKGRVAADRSISDALKGKPVAILDATADPRVQYPQEAKKEGVVSILSVPIILEGECLGVLRVYTDQPRRFTDSDIEFVGTAASMGAVALEKAVFGGEETSEPDYDTFRQQLKELEWARWPGQSG